MGLIRPQIQRAFVGLLLFVFLFGCPALVMAKDLSSRLGVGYKDQFYTSTPSIAVQYYPGPNLGFSLALGVDTKEDASRFGLMAKLYRVIFHEDNMNFYMGSGAGLLSEEQSGRNQSGFELNGFVGAEFFLPGLESLGFSFEAGVAVTSVSSQVRFRTFGDSPLRAGMIFYF